jgi:hypothetical protein
MRAFMVMLLLSLLPGCTPFIPVKDDFGNSALAPAGEIPPEFAEFNNYNPAINPLVAQQLCATPYQPLQTTSLATSTGSLIEARGRCQTHIPLIGP